MFFKTPKKHTTDLGKITKKGGNKLKGRGPGPPSYMKIQMMMKAFRLMRREMIESYTHRGKRLGEHGLTHKIPER